MSNTWWAKGEEEDLLPCVTASVCDVSSQRDKDSLIVAVRDLFHDQLHILINNADQSLYKPAVDTTSDDYSRLMATSLLAHLVHMSSVASFITYPALSLYLLTKGALVLLTRSLTAEWALHLAPTSITQPWSGRQ
ncbi:tropinone reductase homolog At2g29150-like [Phragmites australis]|uniref:tropinone reductase homolog At2g29150-like n=1 Tax=Phragmites australis TaxID=29695 RepID=UPI002D77B5D8|nr:tropinone reductase homolog At2g29150-like [Phragmites australis]